ncbi:MAG: YaeQ family protein [Burkholderiaceae bacterium]
MAQPATICKAELAVADVDRHYYQSHSLVLARHPSETEERMMLRLLAFAWHAGPDLAFGRGLSTDDEPDLWQRDATGVIEHWIDVGWPDDKRLRRAAGRARSVTVFTYGGSRAAAWWKRIAAVVARTRSVSVWLVEADQSSALAALAGRNMTLEATLTGGTVWLGNGERAVELQPRRLDSEDGA